MKKRSDPRHKIRVQTFKTLFETNFRPELKIEKSSTAGQIIDKQKGKRGAVPPGIYADYGFILLQANRTEEGKAMLLKEISLYPESKVFIERILKMTEK